MRVLLVNPPVPESYYNREFYPPLSLLYLGAVLKENGDSVRILDMRAVPCPERSSYKSFYSDRLVATIASYEPDMIGISCLFSGQFPDVLFFVHACKQAYPAIPIVIGGIHPTLYAEQVLRNCPEIDWIILGEGERSTIELVNTLKSRRFGFSAIDGFAWRDGDHIRVNPQTRYIDNLDSIPFPAYSLIDIKDYYVDTSQWHNPRKLPIHTSLPIITSRSCPNRCTFCSMYMVMGPRWRARSPGNVVDEIEYLYNTYGHHHFSFMDDNLTFSREHILEICGQIITRKLELQFETPNGVATGTMDEEVVDAMVQAGLTRIALAIESGSEYIRNKVMKKHLKREKILEVVNLFKKHKHIYIKAFFIIGMPEETRETLEETFQMIRDIDVNRVYIQNAVPFPGTKLFEQAVRDNLLIDVNPAEMYKSDAFYITNYDRYFIRPYQLSVDDLSLFRKKCNQWLESGRPQQKTQQ